MRIEMKKDATQQQLNLVLRKAKSVGLESQLNLTSKTTTVAILGTKTAQLPTTYFTILPGVKRVTRFKKSYKLSSREFKAENTVVSVKGIKIGGERVVVMAGPCAVESEKQIIEAAKAVKESGACVLRGAAFKTRTSPFSFQGLGEAGLELLLRAKKKYKIPVITEVAKIQDISLISRYADILQVGSRNMQNFALLTEIGKTNSPVVLKRGFSCTVIEWLTAADYILKEGNSQVVLCERGIRTLEDSTRFSLDICSIPLIKKVSHLPVIVDPSHAAGHHSLVPAIAKAAVAAGADGLLIEVHPNPMNALSDGPQSLTPLEFARLMESLRATVKSVDRYI
jgi:3-deoxy-7-phosphoheptulonate synthase